ncbi:response regulator [candidate division KSB1 bacterium]|nr:response regulator [candidate division KSB1 bacterium]
MKSFKNRVSILLVEDEFNDIQIIRRAIEKCHITNPLHVVRDGVEAMHFLSNRGKYTDKASYHLPGLILLDINMPRMDGLETLRKIKSDSALRAIPTIVFTSSNDDDIAQQAYESGANTYIAKPADFNEMKNAIEVIIKHWLQITELPKK